MPLLPMTRYSLLFTRLRQPFLPLFLGFLLFFISSLFAASEVQVSAELSRHRAAAGEMVQMDLKVTGAQEADVPHKIAVDGLQINLSGQSKQVQIVNFAVSSSSLYSYIIIPLRSGTFTIPSIQVRADGKYFRTSPQQLTIEGSSTTSNNSIQTPLSPGAAATLPPVRTTPNTKPSSNNQIAFSELIVPKKRLYVGEVVPAEIRFYVDAHYNASPRHGIDFSNEGLLVERLSDPLSSTEERNGILYNVATFHTFISAVKPGPINVGPAKLDLAIDLPASTPADVPDIVAQLMGHAGMMQQHSLTLKSNTISLEAISLPSEGRPDHFSGAIGEFHIDAMALPKKYTLGDPVTLAITIDGDGNVKAISMPELTDTNGWKIYPPTDRVDAPDPGSLHGVKTFEISMIAQEPKTSTPGSLFSYFNPTSGKYVTLSTKPQPLKVIPSAVAAATPSSAMNAVAPVSSPPVIPPAPQTLMVKDYLPRSWQPPLQRKEYLLATGALFLALLVWSAYLGFQRYQKRESLVLQQHLKKMWSELQDHQLAPDLFYKTAVLYAEELLKKDPSRFSELEEIFKRRDEMNYGARETVLRPQERQKIVQILNIFQHGHHS